MPVDITKLKSAVDSLRPSKSERETIFEQIGEAVRAKLLEGITYKEMAEALTKAGFEISAPALRVALAKQPKKKLSKTTGRAKPAGSVARTSEASGRRHAAAPAKKRNTAAPTEPPAR